MPKHPIHIFRAGSHTAMQGQTISFGEADLAASAAAYDPAKHEGPIVVGHPAADAPKAEQPQPDAVPEQSAPEQEPVPQAAPPEPEEERCPFAQPDWKPTTALDHQAVDLVHQLESLMTV